MNKNIVRIKELEENIKEKDKKIEYLSTIINGLMKDLEVLEVKGLEAMEELERDKKLYKDKYNLLADVTEKAINEEIGKLKKENKKLKIENRQFVMEKIDREIKLSIKPEIIIV
ncbi:hypothetical protein ACFO6R_06425 [Eubacterium multiforme]|uniref:Chaperonin cofactor prefoldin n=1 Tax=Eubacterium multiforme TaxID=83339 RepID=A0ABT9USE8_9FIRM|nr:hypothetical protein [Eubacterium multiforme]MDQ0149229.1 chaperonin cofactor prefoldin [Eubacterium multiforme]